MATTRANFSALMYPGLNIIWDEELKQTPLQFREFFNVQESKRADETEQQLAAFGYLAQKYEGEEAIYDDPIQSFERVYYHLTYGLKYRITQEAYEDEQYMALGEKMAQNFGQSAQATQELIAAQVVNNGFNIDPQSPDGVPLFSANHPLAGGGFYGNAPTISAALSQTSLQNAYNTMRGTVNDRGILVGCKPVCLVVSPAQQFVAAQLLHSAQVLVGSDQNPINPIQDSVTLYVWDRLTSSTAWFLMGDKRKVGLKWYDRVKPAFGHYTDNQNQDAVFHVRMRCSAGQSGWRNTYGAVGF
jgi:phage major head subunit gpT-like protein